MHDFCVNVIPAPENEALLMHIILGQQFFFFVVKPFWLTFKSVVFNANTSNRCEFSPFVFYICSPAHPNYTLIVLLDHSYSYQYGSIN